VNINVAALIGSYNIKLSIRS